MTLLGSSLLLLGCLVAAVESAGTCSACMLRNELRSISLSNIKEQILAKLGLSAPPNITGRQLPRIPPLEHFMEPYQADQPVFKPGYSMYEEQENFSATIESVIAFAQPHPKLRHWRGQDMLYFKFSEKLRESRVVGATLWLYIKPGEDSSPVTITILRVTRNPTTTDIPLSTHSQARIRGKGRWVSIDVRRLVAEWFKNPRENMGIAIKASAGQDDHSQHFIMLQNENSPLAPFLEVRVSDNRKQRTKRSLGLNCPENSDETRCCRYPLTVDFEEFGWDFIIAPKKYEANYCSGECPYVFLQKYPHTHIVHMAHHQHGATGPCCAPRKLSSISMLYFDQEFNIIYGLLPGMVVDRCGCS